MKIWSILDFYYTFELEEKYGRFVEKNRPIYDMENVIVKDTKKCQWFR